MDEAPPTLRPLSRRDLDLVRAWRNHPSIRLNMLSQHVITPEEHSRWFDRVEREAHCLPLVATASDGPMGFVQFAPAVGTDQVIDWGFYAAPDAPKGSGQRLCRAAIDHAFGPMGVHKICGQVLASNAASLHVHQRLGFIQEGVLRQHHPLNESWQDLILWGLLRSDWQTVPPQQSPR